MTEKELFKKSYCGNCDRSIYGEYPSYDINIENNGLYVKGEKPCWCKIIKGKSLLGAKYDGTLKDLPLTEFDFQALANCDREVAD